MTIFDVNYLCATAKYRLRKRTGESNLRLEMTKCVHDMKQNH